MAAAVEDRRRKVVLATCLGCGKEFNDETGAGWCVLCDVALKAVEPPELLRDFRWVYENPTSLPVTTGQKRARKIHDEKPEQFLNRLERMEKEWRASVAKAPSTQSAGAISSSPTAAPGTSSANSTPPPDAGLERSAEHLVPEYQEWREFLADREEWRAWKESRGGQCRSST